MDEFGRPPPGLLVNANLMRGSLFRANFKGRSVSGYDFSRAEKSQFATALSLCVRTEERKLPQPEFTIPTRGTALSK